jgi:hypothetical protein
MVHVFQIGEAEPAAGREMRLSADEPEADII